MDEEDWNEEFKAAFDRAYQLAESLPDFPELLTDDRLADFVAGRVSGHENADPKEAGELWLGEKVEEWLAQQLYLKDTGHVDHSLIVAPAGQKDGLDYGAADILVVVLELDGDELAYCYDDDHNRGDWKTGNISDAVQDWFYSRSIAVDGC